MAEAIDTLYVELVGRMERLEADLNRAQTKGRAAATGIAGAFQNAFSRIGDASLRLNAALQVGSQVLNSFKSLAGGVIDLATSFQNSQNQAVAFERTIARTGVSVTDANKLVDTFSKTFAVMPDVVKDASTTLLRNGADLATVEKALMAAGASAKAGGTDVATAMKNVAVAVATGRSELLESSGIITNLGPVYQAYAKSVGKSVEQLTQSEKATAAANAIYRESRFEIADLDALTAGLSDSQGRNRLATAELSKTLGGILLPVVQQGTEFVTEHITKLNDWIKANPAVAGTIMQTARVVTGFGEVLLGTGKIVVGFFVGVGGTVGSVLLGIGDAADAWSKATGAAVRLVGEAIERALNLDFAGAAERLSRVGPTLAGGLEQAQTALSGIATNADAASAAASRLGKAGVENIANGWTKATTLGEKETELFARQAKGLPLDLDNVGRSAKPAGAALRDLGEAAAGPTGAAGKIEKLKDSTNSLMGQARKLAQALEDANDANDPARVEAATAAIQRFSDKYANASDALSRAKAGIEAVNRANTEAGAATKRAADEAESAATKKRALAEATTEATKSLRDLVVGFRESTNEGDVSTTSIRKYRDGVAEMVREADRAGITLPKAVLAAAEAEGKRAAAMENSQAYLEKLIPAIERYTGAQARDILIKAESVKTTDAQAAALERLKVIAEEAARAFQGVSYDPTPDARPSAGSTAVPKAIQVNALLEAGRASIGNLERGIQAIDQAFAMAEVGLGKMDASTREFLKGMRDNFAQAIESGMSVGTRDALEKFAPALSRSWYEGYLESSATIAREYEADMKALEEFIPISVSGWAERAADATDAVEREWQRFAKSLMESEPRVFNVRSWTDSKANSDATTANDEAAWSANLEEFVPSNMSSWQDNKAQIDDLIAQAQGAGEAAWDAFARGLLNSGPISDTSSWQAAKVEADRLLELRLEAERIAADTATAYWVEVARSSVSWQDAAYSSVGNAATLATENAEKLDAQMAALAENAVGYSAGWTASYETVGVNIAKHESLLINNAEAYEANLQLQRDLATETASYADVAERAFTVGVIGAEEYGAALESAIATNDALIASGQLAGGALLDAQSKSAGLKKELTDLRSPLDGIAKGVSIVSDLLRKTGNEDAAIFADGLDTAISVASKLATDPLGALGEALGFIIDLFTAGARAAEEFAKVARQVGETELSDRDSADRLEIENLKRAGKITEEEYARRIMLLEQYLATKRYLERMDELDALRAAGTLAPENYATAAAEAARLRDAQIAGAGLDYRDATAPKPPTAVEPPSPLEFPDERKLAAAVPDTWRSAAAVTYATYEPAWSALFGGHVDRFGGSVDRHGTIVDRLGQIIDRLAVGSGFDAKTLRRP